jgi:hypothetical protein
LGGSIAAGELLRGPCLIAAELFEVSDSALELIEMRYQQMLAVMNLEVLFAEGRFDRT